MAEREAAVDEALRDGACGRRARSRRRAARRARRRSTRRRPPSSAATRRSARRGRSRARPRPSGRRGRRPRATAAPCRSAPNGRAPATLNSGSAEPFSPTSTMSIVLRPQPLRDEAAPRTAPAPRARCVPGANASRNVQKPSTLMRTLSRTESSSKSLFTARAWSNATSHETSSAAACERGEVAHRHHVVEPEDADALAAHAVGEPLAGAVDEHLLVDPRRPVLADVASPRAGRRSPGRPRAAAARRRSGGRSRSPTGR